MLSISDASILDNDTYTNSMKICCMKTRSVIFSLAEILEYLIWDFGYKLFVGYYLCEVKSAPSFIKCSACDRSRLQFSAFRHIYNTRFACIPPNQSSSRRQTFVHVPTRIPCVLLCSRRMSTPMKWHSSRLCIRLCIYDRNGEIALWFNENKSQIWNLSVDLCAECVSVCMFMQLTVSHLKMTEFRFGAMRSNVRSDLFPNMCAVQTNPRARTDSNVLQSYARLVNWKQ